MAPDSNIVSSPSLSAGTLPAGLIARHSAELRNAAPKSIGVTSIVRPSSWQSQIGRTDRVPGTW